MKSRCRIKPMGDYGAPYKQILAYCEFCEYNVECFLIAGRNFPKEMKIQQDMEEEIIAGYAKIDGYVNRK